MRGPKSMQSETDTKTIGLEAQDEEDRAHAQRRYMAYYNGDPPRNPALPAELFDETGRMIKLPDFKSWCWDDKKQSEDNVRTIEAQNLDCLALSVRRAEQTRTIRPATDTVGTTLLTRN